MSSLRRQIIPAHRVRRYLDKMYLRIYLYTVVRKFSAFCASLLYDGHQSLCRGLLSIARDQGTHNSK